MTGTGVRPTWGRACSSSSLHLASEPLLFTGCPRRQPVLGLYHFTEIMSFLNIRASLCHLEGPKYIPKPDRKLFLGCTLFGIIHCFELSGSRVLVTLGACLGLGFPRYSRCPSRLSIHTSWGPRPWVGGVHAELVDGGRGGGRRRDSAGQRGTRPSACYSPPCPVSQERAGWAVGTVREGWGP